MEKVLLSNLGDFVRNLLVHIPVHTDEATIIALSGDLGAGKTTFVQTLAKELGVADTVQSPTYVLMKKYPVVHSHFKTLIHIDAYRLKDAAEFVALKPEVFLRDSQNLVCIEWPEQVEGALPTPDLTVKFSSQDAKEGERYIQFY